MPLRGAGLPPNHEPAVGRDAATTTLPSFLSPEIEIPRQNRAQHKRRAGELQPAPALPRLVAVLVGGGAEGQALDRLVIRRGGRVADNDYYRRRDKRDEDAEVLEVDVVDDPEE